jgi:hypothetical protein
MEVNQSKYKRLKKNLEDADSDIDEGGEFNLEELFIKIDVFTEKVNSSL